MNKKMIYKWISINANSKWQKFFVVKSKDLYELNQQTFALRN